MTGPLGTSGPRTSLAWHRTALTAAGVGTLLLRLGLDRGNVAEIGAGVGAYAAAGVLTFGARRTGPGQLGGDVLAIALVSALTIMTALLTAVALAM